MTIITCIIALAIVYGAAYVCAFAVIYMRDVTDIEAEYNEAITWIALHMSANAAEISEAMKQFGISIDAVSSCPRGAGTCGPAGHTPLAGLRGTKG